MGNTVSLAVSIGIPLVGGIIGGLTSQKDVVTWYTTLKKPRWTPPNFLFGPVWTALYVMMGTASWLVWRKKGNKQVALGLYAAQLVLNLAWNPIFFKTHKTDVALMDITALLGLATAATVTMSRATSPAVQLPLMVPYLVWVSYATALNANIWANNPSERLIKPRGQRLREAQAAKDAAKPGSAVQEAAVAAKDAVGAVKAASEAVAAGSAAVQHGAAAAKPVLEAAAAIKHTAASIKGKGATLGVTAPIAPTPPSATAGSTPATMAPASKAIAKELEQAAAAAASGAGPSPAEEGTGGARNVVSAIEKELKKEL